MRIPSATCRVQFSKAFRLQDALSLVPYLHDLGITDLYASPLLKARAGSTHGYDVTDPTRINPEIGSAAELDSLASALKRHGMGLVLDIVPNHMAASLDNPWWFDVLEKGRASPYSGFFDVNWESRKVLLPILAQPYDEVLEKQEIVLKLEDGRAVLEYHNQRLPLAAGAENLPAVAVDEVLSRQHYRLAFWREAEDAINYRRFFDVNDLIGLRAERDDVFNATHAYPLELLRRGIVTGLRIDHIDGLRDPKAYLDRLPDSYVVVEKILAGTERLPADWRASGTTGYDFANYLNGVFVDPEGYRRLIKICEDITGVHQTYTEGFRQRERQVMTTLFASEVNTLVDRFLKLALDDHQARNLPSEVLREAFLSVTACLPVYRTYIRGDQTSEADRGYIEYAVAAAGRGAAVDFMRRVLLLEPAWYLKHKRGDYLDFVMRWQQFTGAVMAKGLEDTTFYVYHPLLSVNEVGGDSAGPEVYFGTAEFHRRNQERLSTSPHTMNASTTHDTKRSEDTRARINVLSEIPDGWEAALRRWMGHNASETAPDANEQILIYQSLLGAWPIEAARFRQYITKALREAKTHTNWIETNSVYEERVMAFIDRLYSNEAFLKDFGRFHRKVAWFGALSSLAQVVLKIASPGVPDFYRGTDLWDFSLADPDNRRPVDFSHRHAIFNRLKRRASPAALMKNWSDGRIKMYLIWKGLTFRREQYELFTTGDYVPLQVKGDLQDHVIAFARRHENRWCIAAVPRFLGKLRRGWTWKKTSVELPDGAPEEWTDLFTGNDVSGRLLASSIFATLPVALLRN